MNPVKIVKFNKVAYYLRFVIFIILFCLLLKKNPAQVEVLESIKSLSKLSPFFSDVMFINGVVMLLLVTYGHKEKFYKSLKHFLIIIPLIFLGWSYYLNEELLIAIIVLTWAIFTAILFLMNVFYKFKPREIYGYWDDLLSFSVFFISGLFIVFNNLDYLDLQGDYPLSWAIILLVCSAFLLIQVLLVLQNKTKFLSLIFPIVVFVVSLLFSYDLVNRGVSQVLILTYIFFGVWPMISFVFRNKDFKLNG